MTQGTGGRPPPSIVSANLRKLSKVSNKSNRHWWKCNHCPDGSAGSRIEGRDNNHIKHLTDVKKCPNAPAHVRKEARIFLAGKGVKDAFSDPITGVLSFSGNTSASGADQPISDDLVAVNGKRKRTIDGFLDYSLTEVQQARANVKLFR